MTTYAIRVWVGVHTPTKQLHLLLQLSDKCSPNTEVAYEITDFLLERQVIQDKELFQMVYPIFNADEVENLCKSANFELGKGKGKDFLIVTSGGEIFTEGDI